jgi:hypothetical protein
MTPEELDIIFSEGLRVFPIYQTTGNKASYFKCSQGKNDAIEAINTALDLGFKNNTTIYFSVDFDAFVNIKVLFSKSIDDGVCTPPDILNTISSALFSGRPEGMDFVTDANNFLKYTGALVKYGNIKVGIVFDEKRQKYGIRAEIFENVKEKYTNVTQNLYVSVTYYEN